MPAVTRPRPQPATVTVQGGDIGMLSRSFRRSLEVANRSPSTIGIYTISSHLAGGQADGLAGALPEPSLDKNGWMTST